MSVWISGLYAGPTIPLKPQLCLLADLPVSEAGAVARSPWCRLDPQCLSGHPTLPLSYLVTRFLPDGPSHFRPPEAASHVWGSPFPSTAPADLW